MKNKIAFLLFLFSAPAFAQLGNFTVQVFPGVPTGSCQQTQGAENSANQHWYICPAGSWVDVGPGAAGSAAFSSLTPGTNSAIGNFIASGNTWDFSAATVKVPTKSQADGTTNAASTLYVDTGLGGKQNTLGFTPVPNTLTVAGHALNANVNIACGDLSNGAGGCSMSTTAGGDLSGTLPSPTVAKINGNSVPSGAIADQVPVGTAANTLAWKTFTDTSGGAAAVTYTTATHSFGVLSNILTASLTAGRIPFSSGTNALVDSANFTYSATSGISQVQGANNSDMYFAKRFTDTAPTGNFLHFQNASASADLFKLDVLGNLTATSFQANNPSGTAGMLSLIQGSTPTDVPNAINLYASSSVTTGHIKFPSAVVAGIWAQDSSGNLSFGPLSGDVTTSLLVATVGKVNGVSYPSAPSVNTMPIVTGSNAVTYNLIAGGSDCGIADTTHALIFNHTTSTINCGGITATATPGGSPTQIQYNNSGAMGGDPDLIYTAASHLHTFGVGGITLNGSTSGGASIVAPATASGTDTLPGANGTFAVDNASDTTTTHPLFATSTAHVYAARAIAAGDLPTTLTSGTAITNAALTTPALGTPSAVNLSNATNLPCGALPALTGNVTTSSGSCATTVAAVPASAVPAVTVTISTSSPVTVSTTLNSAFYDNQNGTAAGAMTFNLPTAAAGKQFCFANSFNGSAADTGVLTVATSATGQFIIFTDGTLSATGGNVTSGGAAADAACVRGVDSTHWQLYSLVGTWTKH